MATPAWNAVSLRIEGSTISAAEIAALMEQEPDSVGNPKLDPDRRLWVLESGISSDNPLKEHIERLLAFVERKKEQLAAIIPLSEYVELYCGSSQSVELSHDLIRRIADAQLDLTIYFLA